MRTIPEWLEICRNISAGYTPGSDKLKTVSSGMIVAWSLWKAGVIRPGMHILDVGCGNGRLPIGMDINGIHISYYGFDIIKPCIDFCRDIAFKGIPNHHFEHVDVHNAHYWAQGKIDPLAVKYPWADIKFDLIIAMSLFSHTKNISIANRNLAQMSSRLKPEGRIFSTWYFGEKPIEDEAKTVYRQLEIEQLMPLNNLIFATFDFGELTDQTAWILRFL